MLNKVPSGGLLKVENVVDVMKKRYPYIEISSVLGPDSAYDNNRKVSIKPVTVWINILAVLNFERHWQEGLYYFLTFLRTHLRTHAQTDRRSYRLFKWELIVFCQNDRHHLVLCWSDTFFSVSTTFAPNNYNSYWGHISVSPQEGKAYYEQTGVGPLPVVLYNGMPLQREQLDPDELETVVMHKILETTSFFQRAVYLVRMSFFLFWPYLSVTEHQLLFTIQNCENKNKKQYWGNFSQNKVYRLELFSLFYSVTCTVWLNIRCAYHLWLFYCLKRMNADTLIWYDMFSSNFLPKFFCHKNIWNPSLK